MRAVEIRVAKQFMVCNRDRCGTIIERGERYYWLVRTRRVRCMAHRPGKDETKEK